MVFALILRLFIFLWLMGIIVFFLMKLPEIIKGDKAKHINWAVIVLFPLLLLTQKGREQIKKEFK